MNRQSAERIAAEIANDFLDEGLESDAEAKVWLIKKIAAALDEAHDAGFKDAMKKRF